MITPNNWSAAYNGIFTDLLTTFLQFKMHFSVWDSTEALTKSACAQSVQIFRSFNGVFLLLFILSYGTPVFCPCYFVAMMQYFHQQVDKWSPERNMSGHLRNWKKFFWQLNANHAIDADV